jgi:Cu(I)/Ag(I) efflux system membrane protein CusA/SilA
MLQITDRLLKKVPEVQQIFGKAGRADTATDPAPLEMFETVVNLKPEKEWRKGMTTEKIQRELNEAIIDVPGLQGGITMPIKARIDMLATGIRSPLGVKVLGADLKVIEKIALEVESVIRQIKGTNSAVADRVTTGYFLDIKPKRYEIARYGLAVDDVQEVIQSVIGGMNLTVTVEGRERYPVNIRYARELRDDIEKLKRVLLPVNISSVASQMGNPSAQQFAQVPLGELADIRIVRGPGMIKSEEGLLTAYVSVFFSGRDVGSYVEEVKEKVAKNVRLPDGYRLDWSGEYEYMVKTHERLKFVIPLTLLIIFVLIYLNTKSAVKTVIILLAVPFSLVGSFWLLYLLNYNTSIAVWVGMIALAGLDAETGVVMLLYLDLAYDKWKNEGRMKTDEDLKEAIMYGAVKRIRPKLMTVSVILAGLIPIMFSHGAGSDVMKRIAAPMVGGVITSEILELTIYPAIYLLWKRRKFKRKAME